jgi:putative endonuclease
MTTARQKSALGQAGEDHALRFLEAHGYRLIARNWHCRAGELDLVMLDRDYLVFVEVKTRRGERAGRADDAVSRSKATRLLTSGDWFLQNHPEHQGRIWRCDLVAIGIDPQTGSASVHHYENAIVSS